MFVVLEPKSVCISALATPRQPKNITATEYTHDRPYLACDKVFFGIDLHASVSGGWNFSKANRAMGASSLPPFGGTQVVSISRCLRGLISCLTPPPLRSRPLLLSNIISTGIDPGRSEWATPVGSVPPGLSFPTVLQHLISPF